MQRPVADHDAGGMGGGVGIEPLERPGDLEQAAHALVFFHGLAQFLLACQRLGEGDGFRGVLGNQLGELVDLSERHFQHASDAAQNAAREKGAESDDLGDAVGAITLAHIVDHFDAPRLAEVYVEIRHRRSFGIEKTLEEKPEANRIEVSDGQRISDQRPGARAAAGANRNALRLREFDEIRDDQEIAREAHLLDDREFEIEPRGVILTRSPCRRTVRRETLLKPFSRLSAQLPRFDLVEGRGVARFLHEARHDRLAGLRPEADAAGDLQRIGGRLVKVGEKRAHLRAGLEIMLRRNASPVVGARHRAFGDAQQRVVSFEIAGLSKKGFVRRNERQPATIGEVEQLRLDLPFGRRIVPLNFDIEPVAI